MTPSELSDLLWAQVDRVAPHLLPNGKKEGHEWVHCLALVMVSSSIRLTA